MPKMKKIADRSTFTWNFMDNSFDDLERLC